MTNRKQILFMLLLLPSMATVAMEYKPKKVPTPEEFSAANKASFGPGGKLVATAATALVFSLIKEKDNNGLLSSFYNGLAKPAVEVLVCSIIKSFQK